VGSTAAATINGIKYETGSGNEMKSTKIILRIWIAITSLASFVGGWIFLSHAPKPASLTPSLDSVESSTGFQPLPALPTVSSMDSTTLDDQRLQPLPTLSADTPSNFFPRMRTGGS
jgi:hypothetical protein